MMVSISQEGGYGWRSKGTIQWPLNRFVFVLKLLECCVGPFWTLKKTPGWQVVFPSRKNPGQPTATTHRGLLADPGTIQYHPKPSGTTLYHPK